MTFKDPSTQVDQQLLQQLEERRYFRKKKKKRVFFPRFPPEMRLRVVSPLPPSH